MAPTYFVFANNFVLQKFTMVAFREVFHCFQANYGLFFKYPAVKLLLGKLSRLFGSTLFFPLSFLLATFMSQMSYCCRHQEIQYHFAPRSNYQKDFFSNKRLGANAKKVGFSVPPKNGVIIITQSTNWAKDGSPSIQRRHLLPKVISLSRHFPTEMLMLPKESYW